MSPPARPGAPRLILASTSPARRRVLEEAGIRFETASPEVDEASYSGPAPELVETLAVAKATAVRSLASEGAGQLTAPVVVLGCDSLLELDGQALGKPISPEVARQRWHLQRGRTATLWTGYCLAPLVPQPQGGPCLRRAVGSRVTFGYPDDRQIDRYVATGEPLGVAGAFTIEGYGAAFVTEIQGDHNNVLGLSVYVLGQMLAELGIDLTDLWH